MHVLPEFCKRGRRASNEVMSVEGMLLYSHENSLAIIYLGRKCHHGAFICPVICHKYLEPRI